jgi:hypothetical protein
MGRGGEKEVVTFEEVERFGLGGLLDDGESEREQIAEWVDRVEQGETKLPFLEEILSNSRDRKALQREDTREEANRLVDLLLDEETILAIINENSYFDRPSIFHFAHFLGVISDYTALVINRENTLHLRAHLTADHALCGKPIDRREDDTLLPRGSFIHALCEDCEEMMNENMSEDEKRECQGDSSLSPNQITLIQRAIGKTSKASLPIVKDMILETESLESFRDQVGEEVFDRLPLALASILLEFDPETRFANLFYPSRPRLKFSSPEARAKLSSERNIHISAINRLREAIEETYPLAATRPWPEIEIELKMDADAVASEGGLLIDTWASRQLKFATRVACRVWPKAVIAYMDVNLLAGDAGDEIVQEIARDLGL